MGLGERQGCYVLYWKANFMAKERNRLKYMLEKCRETN